MKFDDDGFTLIYDGHQEEGRQLLNYHYYYSLSDLLLRMTLYIYCMTLIYYYYLASIILYTVKLEKECAYTTLCNRVLFCYSVCTTVYVCHHENVFLVTQQLFMTN